MWKAIADFESFDADTARELYSKENYEKALKQIFNLIRDYAFSRSELLLSATHHVETYELFCKQRAVLTEVLRGKGFTVEESKTACLNGKIIPLIIISWAKTKEEN